MEKVSVVVPIYNVKQYLDECVVSLMDQTLKDINIILVDDGSTDGSEVICDKYADEFDNVQVIHKENGGLGSARNVGLKAATGKYVYFIDGDDSIKKEALEKLYILAEKDDLDVILFSAECFSDGLGINYNANEYLRNQYLDEVFSGKDLFVHLVDANQYYASIPLRFYRTEYLQSREYQFPECIIHEDEIYAYWSLIQANKALCISNRFYNRRFRVGSIMTSKKAYDSCIGYIHTWKEMVLSIDALSEWKQTEKERAIHVANNRLEIVARLYLLVLDRLERRQLDKRISELKEIAEKRDFTLTSKSVSFFLVNPHMYYFLYRIYDIKPTIRYAIDNMHEKSEILKALLKLKYIHAMRKGCAILIGTPTHGNLGDQAIVLAERNMLSETKYKRRIIEICSKNYLKYTDIIEKTVSSEDIIIIDGGGSMGTLWVNNEYRFRDIINRFKNNAVYIFPQTIYYGREIWEQKVLQESKMIYAMHSSLTIFCRDKDSYTFAKDHFRSNMIYYTPDMVLSLYPQKIYMERKPVILICFRDDIESNNTGIRDEMLNMLRKSELELNITSTLTGGYIDRKNRKKEVINKWNEFASVKLVITDRLHAMIFCALTGTPCVAIDNRSRKVSGTYAWISELPFITLIENCRDLGELDLDYIISNADYFRELGLLKDKFKELKDIFL